MIVEKNCFQEGALSPLPLKGIEQMSLTEIYESSTPPKLPQKLPKLVSTVTSQTPEAFKATVAQAMFPSLAIYPIDLSFKYLDGQERELRLNCLTAGPTGSGKDTCLRPVLKHILADAVQRDAINRGRLAEFNAEYNSKAANAEKPHRPEDLRIQVLQPDVTRAALYLRMVEAQGAPLQYVMNDGPISRLTLATTPNLEIGSDMPVFGKYDDKYDAKLRPFIENLKNATGRNLVCKPAIQIVKQIKQELDDYLVLTQEEILNNLSRRALVHVFRKACLIYAANGMKSEPALYDFCRWSLHYDLYLKMRLYGDAIRKEDNNVKFSKRGPQNLLAELTNEEKKVFSYDELVKLRLQRGMDEKGTRKLLSKWKQRGYIRLLTDDSFERVK